MKKLFKKAQAPTTNTLSETLKELYCTFDEHTALIKLRKMIRVAKDYDFDELGDYIEDVILKDARVDAITCAIPCLCEVRFRFRPITGLDFNNLHRPFTYTRYYTAYGVNARDVDAYLDTAIQLDMSTFEEALSDIYKIDYTIEDIVPCVK
jgi:hypothetical protein